MLTDLEATTQYTLKIITVDVYVKLIVQVADAEAEKNCSGFILVVLIKKQSVETLKLLVNFQMMA